MWIIAKGLCNEEFAHPAPDVVLFECDEEFLDKIDEVGQKLAEVFPDSYKVEFFGYYPIFMDSKPFYEGSDDEDWLEQMYEIDILEGDYVVLERLPETLYKALKTDSVVRSDAVRMVVYKHDKGERQKTKFRFTGYFKNCNILIESEAIYTDILKAGMTWKNDSGTS